MIKTYKSFLISAFLVLSYAWGSIQVSGSVTSTDGKALPYANVSVLGLNVGSASSEDGTFLLTMPSEFKLGSSVVLKAGYIGYKSSEKTLVLEGPDNVLNFSLEADVLGVEEVVVTALGISKAKKALGYSVQDIKSDELNMVQQDNIVDALSGKVAGVQVLGSAGASLGGLQK